MRQRLRLYFVKVVDDDCGLAVAAHSAKEARAIIWKGEELPGADRIIDLRVRWLKQAVVSGLRPGTILYDVVDGLRRGAYSWAEGPRAGHIRGRHERCHQIPGCPARSGVI